MLRIDEAPVIEVHSFRVPSRREEWRMRHFGHRPGSCMQFLRQPQATAEDAVDATALKHPA